MAAIEEVENNANGDVEENGVEGNVEDESSSGIKLPIARVKRIMKADPDLNIVSQDAVYLVTKATELFIESFVQEAYRYTMQAKKKTVSKRDVDNCIESIDALAFLDGAME